eukprot:scaffold26258_cov60-Phaeocystis_antarctica.AAC.1
MNVNGTRGIMVQPKAGSAILWPSTLDAAPMHADHRTNHAAQPVTQGIKFAANMWIHQFDFKTPSERGCQLTYVNTVGANLALALALAQTQAQTQALP